MPYDLAALDRIEQRFVRRGTSLFVETYNVDTLAVLDSFEFTNAPQTVPAEVRELARGRLLEVVSPAAGGGEFQWAAGDKRVIVEIACGAAASPGSVEPSGQHRQQEIDEPDPEIFATRAREA